ncbi:DNA polymerase I [Pleurocapsa sp. PCC 7327]|uniref:DNA polymerase I n=1 Tax=Pleurocapsa sp. PCC 7327 TaxID=118163 RepID=UPI00029FD695|nr:DNA polymerase I [Pleurocapsa sp. PCC 7327]AFY76219.1 DNA polymerase I [Pleurocapsa sp. PCC 7327]
MPTSLASTPTNSETSPLFILIDGHSLAFRAYYAFATSRQGLLRTSTGIPTSVCFGFLNSLVQVIESQQPQYIAIAFDRGEVTFRHEADANYKANRQEAPDDFLPDLKNLQELLLAFNLQIVTSAGYEADDVIGTLAKQASEAGYRVKIVSGDRDLFQLVDLDKSISVLYIDRNTVRSSSANYTEFDPAAVEEKLGIKPYQVVDYKALCGDKSDNIPGVRGIGEKTAVKLLEEYGSLEGIYQNLDKIQGAVKKKLEEGKQDAEHSRHLAQIVLNAPVEVKLEDCKLQGFNVKAVKPLLEKLELKTIITRLDKLQQQFGGKSTEIISSSEENSTSQQLSLFERSNSSVKTSKQAGSPSSISPQIIDTQEKLTGLIALLKTHIDSNKPVAWDTETTSINPREAKLVGIGCCWGEKPTDIAYIPVCHGDGICLETKEVLEALRPILESSRYPKVFQNTKFDRNVFWKHGIKLAGVVFDTMLASYVIHPELNHKLSDICDRYLSDICSQNYDDLGIPKGKNIGDLDIQTVANYCGMDAYVTFLLMPKLKAELEKNPELYKLLLDIELPLEPVLAAMETRGIRIDVNYLKEFSVKLERDLQAIEQQIYEEAGEKFNLGSPKKLSEVLFDKLGLNSKKSRKMKTGYSTDRAILEKLQGDHPIIDKILEHRTLVKLKSTYVDALPQLVSPDTKRIHTDFNQTITATGRLSSSNPNLQNIPIRTEFSRQIRKAFIPEEGWLLVSADYSQIELRILAHLCQEPLLVEAYRQGEDVHSVTAKVMFNTNEITPEQRNLGKTINFGVIYGMGAHRFAQSSGLSVEIGKDFIEKYRQKYARVFTYLERVKKEAIAKGYVTTIFGRRRYFDFANENLQKLRGSNPEEIDLDALKLSNTDAQLLRAAANAPIQGSSADIIKIAMVKLHKILQDYQARLLLQVHDELVFEVPPTEWEELQPKIKFTMENAVELTVPLVVEVRAGKNWMEAK